MGCDNFASRANDKISIEAPTATPDVYGGRSSVMGETLNVWAIIEPMSGKEVFAQQDTQSRVTHKFIIRYQPTLKNVITISDYRISFDSRLFAVKYIRNLDTDMKTHGTDYQEILAVENDADIHG